MSAVYPPPRRVIVVDLDGVVFQSPASETITDPDFWRKLWSDPSRQIPNPEILHMIGCLNSCGYLIYFLTARPSEFMSDTLRALFRFGFNPEVILGSELLFSQSLRMWDLTPEEAACSGFDAASWKASVIRILVNRGYEVAFAIEDHKPCVEAIRRVVPVLAYERTRGH